MKVKKAVIMAMVCSFIIVLGANAFAEDWGWYECTVVRAGTGGARFEVKLSGTKTSGASTATTINKWYEFHENITADISRVVIATILTATSNGFKVEALVIPDRTKSLYALYLIPS